MRKSRIYIFPIILTLLFSINYAEKKIMNFDEAFYKSNAVEKYQLQNKKDSFNYLRGYYAKEDLKDFYEMYYEYPIYLEFDERLRNEIAFKTTERKIELGNQISKSGYMLELNTKYYNFKMLELATLNSKQNLDLNKMKLELEEKKLGIEKQKFKLGKSREIDLKNAKNSFKLMDIKYRESKIEYEKNSKKLFYYLGAEIKIEPEAMILSKLQPIDEYLKNVDYRFEIISKAKKNEISKLEIDIYESKRSVLSPKQIDELDKKNRLYLKNELEIQMLRLQIRNELIKGYNELKNKKNQVENFEVLYQNQKIRKKHIAELLELGKISKIEYLDFEIKFKEVEYGYNMKVMDYNNYYRKFQNAISVGPKL